MITDQELIDRITKSFIIQEPKSKGKKVKPCRIKWMGKFVRLQSGKTVWRCVGDAKNALRNHFGASKIYQGGKYNYWLGMDDILALIKTGDEYYKERGKLYREFIQVLQDKKILQFVEVDFETLAILGKQ